MLSSQAGQISPSSQPVITQKIELIERQLMDLAEMASLLEQRFHVALRPIGPTATGTEKAAGGPSCAALTQTLDEFSARIATIYAHLGDIHSRCEL